jgi:hypothetical protein
MVITEIKDLPHTGLYKTQTQPSLMLGSQTQCTQVTLPSQAWSSKLETLCFWVWLLSNDNPQSRSFCSHMVIASHSSEVCLIFSCLRMRTKLPNLEFLQFNKVQLISLDYLNFSVQMFLSWMFSFVDFAWKDWVNLASSTSAQVISSGALHEIYFLRTSTIWVLQQEILLTWTWEFHMSIMMLDWELDPIFIWKQKYTCSETLGRRSKNGCSILFCTNLSIRERVSLLLFSANWLFPNFWGWQET